jgi:hypothetical protein
VEPVPPAPNDFEPSAELIASAPEDAAPATLEPHSAALAPHADVADTLAHESSYAEALAEVVHIDEPYTKSPESEKPVVEETAPAPTATPLAAVAGETAAQSVEAVPATEPAPPAEHHAEPVVEGLAAAAAVAAVTAMAAEPPSTPVSEVPPEAGPSEPVVAPVQSAEPAEAAAKVTTTEEPTPAEPAAAVVSPASEEAPAPLPHPLFPIPRHVEHAPFEVLPPPSLPLRRFDQDAVQALFMTEETLDLPKISRLAAGLPGMYACVIATRDQACTGGTLPEGFDLAALLGLAPRVGEAAGRMPIGALKHFTLYGEAYSVSFFERNGLSLCAVHRPRSFVPGVREKLVALADELSR